MSNIQSRSYNMNRDHSAAADLVIKSCANRLDNIISLIMDHLYYSIKCVVVCESWLSENVFPIKYADSLLWIFSNGKNYRDKSIICRPPCYLYDPSRKQKHNIELPKEVVGAKIFYSKYILLDSSLQKNKPLLQIGHSFSTVHSPIKS